MSDEATQTTPQETTQTETPKTFTQEELDKIVQDRLAQHTRKVEREQERLRRESKEQADLEKLQGEERLKKQFEMDRAKLEQERDTYLRELRLARAESVLASKGLDPKFAAHMIGTTDEETQSNIASLEKLVSEQVASRTKEALSKGAPPAGSGGSPQNDLLSVARKAAGLK